MASRRQIMAMAGSTASGLVGGAIGLDQFTSLFGGSKSDVRYCRATALDHFDQSDNRITEVYKFDTHVEVGLQLGNDVTALSAINKSGEEIWNLSDLNADGMTVRVPKDTGAFEIQAISKGEVVDEAEIWTSCSEEKTPSPPDEEQIKD